MRPFLKGLNVKRQLLFIYFTTAQRSEKSLKTYQQRNKTVLQCSVFFPYSAKNAYFETIFRNTTI